MTPTEFFSFLDPSPKTYLALTAFLLKPNESGKFIEHHFFLPTQLDQATKLVDQLAPSADLYVRTTHLKSKPKYGRGRKDLTASTSVLWVDLDASPQTTRQDLLQRLHDFKLPPSLAVSSGSGVHAYWKLSEPLTSVVEIEQRTKWLADQLHADKCWNATQILRIPGTFNHKDPEHPKPVEVLFATEKTYSSEEFGLAELPDPSQIADLMEFRLEEEPLPPDFLDLLEKPLRDRVTTGRGAPRKADGALDRSQNDYFIVMSLLERGFSPGQTLTVLTKSDWVASLKTRQLGARYAVDTVLSCVRTVAEKTDEDETRATGELSLRKVITKALSVIDDNGNLKRKKLDSGEEIVEPVIRYLEANGVRLLVDDQTEGVVLSLPTGDFFPISQTQTEFTGWLYRVSGYTENEFYHKVLRSGLIHHARHKNEKAKLTPWCYYDPYRASLHILLDTVGRQILLARHGETPARAPNGVDGIFLQPSSMTREPIEFNPEVDIKSTFEQFLEIFTEKLACDPAHQEILTGYLLSLPIAYGLAEHIQMFPLLHIRGPSGGGKSQTLKMMSAILNGTPNLLNTTVAAGYRTASRELMMPYDDYEDLSLEVRRFILTGTTGVTRQMSSPDSSHSVVNQYVHSFMAMTSINDLDDEALTRRALVVEVNHGVHKVPEFTDGHWVRLQEMRSNFWSAYALWLSQNPITIEEILSASQKISERVPSIFRGQAPFLALLWTVLSKFDKQVETLQYPSFDRAMDSWFSEGVLNVSQDIIYQKLPILDGLRGVFEAYKTRGWHHYRVTTQGSNGSSPEEHRQRIVETVYRDTDFRLQHFEGSNTVGFEGTTTEWLVTMKAACRGMTHVQSIERAQQLGFRLRDLAQSTGQKPPFPDPVSVAGFNLQQISLGPNRGWRVTIDKEEVKS